MADGFELARQDDQKLWVRTPFPVTHNVWGFFVKEIFPRFSIDESKAPFSNFYLRDAMKRWDSPRHKYLVREQNPDGSYKSCIADGEGFRWTHADLPDDKRAGLRVDDWGLIYIPNPAQFRYLDSIARDLRENSIPRSQLLYDIHDSERSEIKGLLLNLKKVLDEKPDSADKLRERVMGVYGDFPWMFANYQTIERLGIGKLPMTSKNPMNTIEGQTKLDFYRALDFFLDPAKGPVPGNGGIRYCMDATYRHLNGEWIICPELNDREKLYPVARMLSDLGPL